MSQEDRLRRTPVDNAVDDINNSDTILLNYDVSGVF
jgi:hypothetical protein